jgi:hypothetical protein
VLQVEGSFGAVVPPVEASRSGPPLDVLPLEVFPLEPAISAALPPLALLGNRSIAPFGAREQAAPAQSSRLRASERAEDECFGFITREPVLIICQIAARKRRPFFGSSTPHEGTKAIDARILR